MSKKTVCDICGADADDTQYTVPFIKQYWAVKNGIAMVKFDRMETCEFNFCDSHRRQLAYCLKSWRDAYNKV